MPAPTSRRLELVFGALAEPLAVQLKRPPRTVKMWQADSDAITRLLVRGLISDAVGRHARQRLINQIAKEYR